MSLISAAITITFTVSLLLTPSAGHAMTAQEILTKSIKENFSESFRIPLSVKTYKGSRMTANHVIWIMGRTKDQTAQFFVEFEEPKESKGLRFLFLLNKGHEPKAYMHAPATGKTLPLALDNKSVNMGGTGLSLEDIQGFIPQEGEEETLLREEKIDGRDAYVIRISSPDRKGERLLWVSKDDFFVLKSETLDAKGKLQKIFKVVEFFKTLDGKSFPREEEITITDKNMKIRVRQEGAVFGISIPDELLNPEKFGTYKWRD